MHFQLEGIFWTSSKHSIITCLQLHPSQKGLSAQENEHLIVEQPFHPQIASIQVGPCVHLRENVLLIKCIIQFSFSRSGVLMTPLITR